MDANKKQEPFEEMKSLLDRFNDRIQSALDRMETREPKRKRMKRHGDESSGESSAAEESSEESILDQEDPDEDNQDKETEAKKAQKFVVSEPTKAFLEATFCLSRPVDNKTRRSWLEKFGVPEGDATRCPKMDTIIKGELPKEAMESDRKLSKMQNFALDATGPLVAAMEDLTGSNPSVERVLIAIQTSLRCLGNASAHFSQERRGKALSKLNPDLKSMLDDEDFSGAPPYLFGPSFEKKEFFMQCF
jgi:hypothetical protein